MADDVVPDRLAEIKARDEPSFAANRVEQAYKDVAWLIAEVERLREKNDRQVFYGQRALDVAEDIVALRGALQALVDATDDPAHDWNKIDAARAAAVALLAGPGGET